MINPLADFAFQRDEENDTFTRWMKVGLQRRFSLVDDVPDELVVLVDHLLRQG